MYTNAGRLEGSYDPHLPSHLPVHKLYMFGCGQGPRHVIRERWLRRRKACTCCVTIGSEAILNVEYRTLNNE